MHGLPIFPRTRVRIALGFKQLNVTRLGLLCLLRQHVAFSGELRLLIRQGHAQRLDFLLEHTLLVDGMVTFFLHMRTHVGYLPVVLLLDTRDQGLQFDNPCLQSFS